MKKQFLTAFIALVLLAAFTAPAFAQEKQDMKKDEKSTMAKPAGQMVTYSCKDECGFMVRSHDDKEAMGIMKDHAKKMHKMKLTDDQLKSMKKVEDMPSSKN